MNYVRTYKSLVLNVLGCYIWDVGLFVETMQSIKVSGEPKITSSVYISGT